MGRILVIAMFVEALLPQIPEPVVNPTQVAAAVAPGDTVLTIRGICAFAHNALATGGEDCSVLVKRQQFDDLLEIVSPKARATSAGMRVLAKTYADLLAFEMAARSSGIENSAQFRETMEWLRLRTLADLYRRALEKDSNLASEQEIDEYYRRHISEFEEVKLRRVLLPKNNFAVSDKEGFEKKVLGVATDIRVRAVKGEEMDQLQKEAYTTCGFDTLPPATEVGTRRRSALTPETSEDIFSLRPGEVSKVLKEAFSFVIYKVEAKWTLPKERVRDEISREISRLELETALKSVTSKLRFDLNENYFGPATDR